MADMFMRRSILIILLFTFVRKPLKFFFFFLIDPPPPKISPFPHPAPLPLSYHFSPLPRRAEALLHPGAPGLELDLALRLQDAQHLLGALGREPLARREPGDRLVLPEEGH